MTDRLVSAAAFRRDNAVQAFPLGGRVHVIPVSASDPAPLAGLDGVASLVLLSVPTSRMLYVGNAVQIASLVGDPARAAMFPVPAGTWTFSLVDEDEGDLVVLGDQAFDLRVLQAAVAGPEV